MELVVSVFDEHAEPFFNHLRSCSNVVSNVTFYVHEQGYRSHFTTGTKGFKITDARWFAPPFGTTQSIPNKGDEALAYASYIVQRYHTLPSYVAFVHAHASSWHSHSMCQYLQSAIRSQRRFVSFNKNNAKRHCEILNNNSTSWKQRAYSHWETWFDESPPRYLPYQCCAQFMVSRESIRRHSLSTWNKIHQKALEYHDTIPEQLPFEFLWPSILDNSTSNVPCS